MGPWGPRSSGTLGDLKLQGPWGKAGPLLLNQVHANQGWLDTAVRVCCRRYMKGDPKEQGHKIATGDSSGAVTICNVSQRTAAKPKDDTEMYSRLRYV